MNSFRGSLAAMSLSHLATPRQERSTGVILFVGDFSPNKAKLCATMKETEQKWQNFVDFNFHFESHQKEAHTIWAWERVALFFLSKVCVVLILCAISS